MKVSTSYLNDLAILDLTGNEYRIVLMLADQEMYLTEIATLLGVEKANISRNVNKLISLNLLKVTRTVGAARYLKTNLSWKNSGVLGQIDIQQFL